MQMVRNLDGRCIQYLTNDPGCFPGPSFPNLQLHCQRFVGLSAKTSGVNIANLNVGSSHFLLVNIHTSYSDRVNVFLRNADHSYRNDGYHQYHISAMATFQYTTPKKAKPLHFLWIIASHLNTFGCTIPAPRISIQPVPLHTGQPLPLPDDMTAYVNLYAWLSGGSSSDGNG